MAGKRVIVLLNTTLQIIISIGRTNVLLDSCTGNGTSYPLSNMVVPKTGVYILKYKYYVPPTGNGTITSVYPYVRGTYNHGTLTSGVGS